uniref:Major facilitator superfamily (MFS) profile domain-containing protein n=1 Tax=Fabrea salina TaxID=342563 RepID=A0A7S3MRR1_9CILI|mmetsp:Transcript_1242/g.1978  ORF Transcript_1242/g.1978 Transcript_1242/m.1978 type:complete len:497 (+) Transcript_1242:118-1608(+)
MADLKGDQKAGTEETPPIDISKRKATYIMFCLIACTINFDAGIIPAGLYKIRDELEMSFQQQAAIGSLVFMGISLGSLTVTATFQKVSAAKALILMLTLNIAFTVVFSLSKFLYLLYLCRLIMGFTKSFFVIYGPVWVNEFSPKESSTKWLAGLQASVTMGIMLGYGITGFFVNSSVGFLTWRFAVQLQASLLVPLFVWLRSTDSKLIDTIDPEEGRKILAPGDSLGAENHTVRVDSVDMGHISNFLVQLKMLYKNPLFVMLTSAMCALSFVFTGIQYWITLYLILYLGSNPLQVVIAFSLICSTAPMAGVMFGGWLSDHMGGYRGANLVTALQLCLVFAVLASLFSIPMGFVGNLTYVSPLLWIMLFFGGALFPTATGININTLAKQYQSSVSSISQLVFNLGAYLAPVLSAAVMDAFEDPEEGLKWGFRFILLCSVLGVFPMVGAWIFGIRTQGQSGEYLDFEEERDAVGDLATYTNSEMRNEILRRRLHSFSL